MVALVPSAPAAERFSTGPERAVLIELFTSEGCSSCPPADRWLGALRDKPGLWTAFSLPIAFHVNYWDALGWKDRLSTGDFTAREYAYASAWGRSNVATPCFVRNGMMWKPVWGAPGGAPALTGVLALDIGADGLCRVEFTPGPGAKPAPDGHQVHLVVLGGGIDSHVTDGENKGETLQHEFVKVPGNDAADPLPEPGCSERALRPSPAHPDPGRSAAPGGGRLGHPDGRDGGDPGHRGVDSLVETARLTARPSSARWLGPVCYCSSGGYLRAKPDSSGRTQSVRDC